MKPIVWRNLTVGAAAFGTGLLLVGCATDDRPPPLHSVLRLERTGETQVANANTVGNTNLNIADWETNHFQPAAGAGYGVSGGVGVSTGAASSGTVGLGSSTSTSSLGATSGFTPSGTVTNMGGGVVTPLPSLSTPSSTIPNSSSSFGSSATNVFGAPR